jgi:hypothetical protein
MKKGAKGKLQLHNHDGERREIGTVAADEVIELSVPFAAIGATPASSLQFQVKVFHDGIERECYPESAPFEVITPGSDAALANWNV